MTSHSKEDLDRVIRKIKHCLALTSSTNEHEAAAAMRQAQKLMAKYRLTALDVQMSDVGHQFGPVARVRLKRWESDLGAVVGQAFGCEAIQYRDWANGKDRQRMLFAGVSPAQEIAAYAYGALHAKVAYDRKKFLATLKPDKRRKHTPATRADHFALAWVWGVKNKLQALVPPSDGSSDEHALMVVQQQGNALIEAYVSALGEVKSINRPELKANQNDLMAGLLAGRKAELHRGVTTGAEQFQIGTAA